MLRDPHFKGKNVVEEEGKSIFRLLSGDPSLYEGGWDTPQYMKDAVIRAIKEGYNMYPNRLPGLEEKLIEAIIGWEKNVNSISYCKEDIIPTQGVSGGIQLIYSSILKPKDKILITDPGYPPYISQAKNHDANIIFFETKEEEDWIPNLDDLRKKITNQTKGLVLIHPHNPTGALYDDVILKKIVNIAGEYDVPIISDEIYGLFLYDLAKFRSISSIASDVPCLIMNSLSKAYVSTGWRLGYIAIHDPHEKINDIRKTLEVNKPNAGTIPTPLVYGAIAAYKGPTTHITKMLEELNKRRILSYKKLNEIDGISCYKPKAAFFVFPKIEDIGKIWKNDVEYTLDLKSTKYLEVGAGSNYGSVCASGHIRIPFLPSYSLLDEIYDKIESFMKERIARSRMS